eukprot:CAMPEP_0197438752 /NCGR_PEP_ID=MMETSP1175-20131217/5661_1 /TAXON_ID=1003142 /ORGANISM="Triceratium dubium, Strain CCMP147" /LENGTH=34 /DNA_ID= /DNA_START= /DNA_END= /DNA_ORIENTATION=
MTDLCPPKEGCRAPASERGSTWSRASEKADPPSP